MRHIYTSVDDNSAERARISAQETVLGQAFSTAVLIWFTTSKPLRELIFGKASCSVTMVSVLFSKTDASQPCYSHRSHNILAAG